MVHVPTDEELAALEKAAIGDANALRAFDDYLGALSALEEARDEEGLDLKPFQVEVAMTRCELDVRIGNVQVM